MDLFLVAVFEIKRCRINSTDADRLFEHSPHANGQAKRHATQFVSLTGMFGKRPILSTKHPSQGRNRFLQTLPMVKQKGTLNTESYLAAGTSSTCSGKGADGD